MSRRTGWIWGLLASAALSAQEPALPPGLGEPPATREQPAATAEPALPPGLGGEAPQEPEPGLPPGLGGEAPTEPEPGLPPGLAIEPDPPPTDVAADVGAGLAEQLGVSGFFETRAGSRTQRDPYQRTLSVAESRLRLELDRQFGDFVFKAKGDLLADALATRWQPDLESGGGCVDLREASAATSPLPWLDLKVGRQVLTWGTGDLLFVNDLFPKDWVSFFVGRDDEYLKAPSDALRAGLFTDLVDFDFVYTPRFDANRYISGERISYFNPMLLRRAGRDAVQRPITPDDWFQDDEFAARLHKNVDGVELAAYGYVGYQKSPTGFDPASGRATFPTLSVYGASVRTQLASGIANAEVGYYDSRSDRAGDDPFADNSQLRLLVGYERDLPELADSLTVGAQYYLEAMLQYGAYRSTLPAGMPAFDEYRHVATLRVTKLLLDSRLRLSLFGYFSPSDRDVYLRPNAAYTIADNWTLTVGANLFAGENDYTFFGQFDRNSNVFAAMRVSF